MSEWAYPFVDLRPSLQFTRPYWDALSEQEREDALRTAAWANVRVVLVDDEPAP